MKKCEVEKIWVCMDVIKCKITLDKMIVRQIETLLNARIWNLMKNAVLKPASLSSHSMIEEFQWPPLSAEWVIAITVTQGKSLHVAPADVRLLCKLQCPPHLFHLPELRHWDLVHRRVLQLLPGRLQAGPSPRTLLPLSHTLWLLHRPACQP